MGSLISQEAVDNFLNAIKKAKDQGGEVIFGGARYHENTNYVIPTIIKAKNNWSIVQEETLLLSLFDDI